MKTNIATDLAKEIAELRQGKSDIQFLVNNLKETYYLHEMSTLKVNTTLVSEDFSQKIVINETHEGEHHFAIIDHYVEGQRISRRRVDAAKIFNNESEPSVIDVNGDETLPIEDVETNLPDLKTVLMSAKKLGAKSVVYNSDGISYEFKY